MAPQQMVEIPFTGGSYISRSLSMDSEVCINYYPEAGKAIDQSVISKSRAALYPTEGLITKVTISNSSSVRGMLSYNERVYAVIDNDFYEFVQSADGTTLTGTLRGSLPVGSQTGPVKMITNGSLGNQIMIVDGTNKYYFDTLVYTFAAIDDDGLGLQTNYVTYLDGYAILPQKDTNQWFITGLSEDFQLPDFSVIDPLDFASTTTKADVIIAAETLGQYVYLFTETGAEVVFNAGTTALDGTETQFPFAKVTQLSLEQGLAAPFSLAKGDNTLFFLSASDRGAGYVCRIDGQTPSIISTTAINNQIDNYSTISDAIGFVYQNNGHEFYVLTFPTADRTWVYDISTKTWHERRSAYEKSPSTGIIQGRFRANCYAKLNGVHYVGDYQSGKIFQMTDTAYDEAGTTITRIRACPHMSEKQQRISVYSLELDVSRGIGIISGQGSDPGIILEVSRDGGRTFIDKGSESMGVMGEYQKRCRWNLLGQARDWVFRITVTDPIEHVIMGAFALVEVENG